MIKEKFLYSEKAVGKQKNRIISNQIINYFIYT